MRTLLNLSIIILLSCNSDKSDSDLIAQNISILVTPNETDTNYPTSEESHYVVRNNKVHLKKLLLFIGGSYSIPKNYNLICDHAASIGLDVISLSYPNSVATASLGTSSDALIFDSYRDEICFGNPVSNVVSVDILNSIETRATKLLLYLRNAYPSQDWGQYLTSSNTLQWSSIILSGHSQGSGHACYLGKKKSVDRVVMFSGPNDYSIYYSTPANWLSQPGLTPLTSYFSLLHTQDEIVAFNYQVANLKALGLLSSDESPTLADNLTPPYQDRHALSLNIVAISNHNSTIGANKILPDIWTYMLTNK